MIPRHAIGIAALALALTGCGERTEPLAPDVSPYPVSARGAGDRPAVLNSRPERVVALDPGAADLVAAVGAADRLVGVPSEVSAAVPEDATRVVGLSGQVDVGRAVELEPDLVVTAAAVDPGDVSRVYRATGAALYIQPDRSLREVERAAVELGLLLDEAVAGRLLAQSIRRKAAAVAARIGARRSVRVFVDTGFLITVPARSLLGDLVRRAGGESVAGPTPPPDGFAPCDVVRFRPETILTTESRTSVLRRLIRAGCPARGIGIVELPTGATQAGPRVAQALERIARALHPDAFA
jgi:iron complex transport system substrate-binding protein